MACKRKPLPLHATEVVASESISKNDLLHWTLKNVLVLALIERCKLNTCTTAHLNDASSESTLASSLDIFKTDTSIRFPKEFLKVLFQNLERISMGRDEKYTDQTVRGVVAVFYNNVSKRHIMKQIKSSRKVEDLVLLFTSSCSSELQKRRSETADKHLMEDYLYQFMCLCEDTAVSCQACSAACVSHIRMYKTKLLKHNEILSSKRATKGNISIDLSSLSSLQIIAQVFEIPFAKVLVDAENIFATVDAASMLEDLALLRADLENDVCKFTYSVMDFASYSAYAFWKAKETQTLDQLTKMVTSCSPSLQTATPVKTSRTTLQYLPKFSRSYYRQLLFLCIRAYLNGSTTYAESELRSFVRECGIFWRIQHPSRVAVALDVIRELLQAGLFSADLVELFFREKQAVQKSWPITNWLLVDKSILEQAISLIKDLLVQRLKTDLNALLDCRPSLFNRMMSILNQYIYSLPQFENMSDQDLEELRAYVNKKAKFLFEELIKQDQDEHTIDGLMLAVDNVRNYLVSFRKVVADIRLGATALAYIVQTLFLSGLGETLSSQAQLYVASATADEMQSTFNDMIALYLEVNNLFTDSPELKETVSYKKIEGFFQPFIDAWLTEMEQHADSWLGRALEKDSMPTQTGELMHSSSVEDLFQAFHQALSMLLRFNWTDELVNARFFSKLFRSFFLSTSKYAEVCLSKFNQSLTSNHEADEDVEHAKATWLSRAKDMFSSSAAHEAFFLSPEMCIQLNNVNYALSAFESLENKTEVRQHIRALGDLQGLKKLHLNEKAYYTITVLRGEGLPTDSSGRVRNVYVVLTDSGGHRVGKTKSLCTLNPRWNKSFEMKSKGPVWINATVWERGRLRNHEVIGRASFCLDPKVYGDYVPREMWYNLNTKGELLIRTEMEGEKEHIGFYIGRTYHVLQHTKNEMIKSIVDNMVPVMEQYLSPSNMKQFVNKSSWSNFDKTLSSVTNLLSRSKVTPSDDDANAASLSESEVEAAINSLFDYFDLNFPVFAQNLSKSLFDDVMSSVWDEALSILEDLLIPPLSDKPSSRKPLNGTQTRIVYMWLQFLLNYFNANGEGVDMKTLQSDHYKELLVIQEYYSRPEEELIRQCETNAVRLIQGVKSGESVKSSHGLADSKKLIYRMGTIRNTSTSLSTVNEVERLDTIILRILRMRSSASDFLRKHMKRKDRLLLQSALKKGVIPTLPNH
ncbi:C2 domain-containing protein [Schizosaccharomyces japonicus yFS275]|uniref:C2 domain-containing protein n=1 Tax=Schizosaccharomyces japonicus (strain yFS275 / FY16936) TaxID=402676 RepID=B6K0L6_SCHJY|nr:C2 domain-containing protein [Schizosaccharomyces japonicus yFS275]EEB07487.2 C2 domain-containing protein [Schizosaccharomyces japonicus yFS275]